MAHILIKWIGGSLAALAVLVGIAWIGNEISNRDFQFVGEEPDSGYRFVTLSELMGGAS